MRVMQTLPALILAAAVTVAVGAASRVPYRAAGDSDSVLRLTWRVRGERVDECRHLTKEEQAALPAHMRREEICEGRIAPYRLSVDVDGRSFENSVFRPAGARQDRPIYVYREIRLAPGPHHLVIAFTREGPPLRHAEGIHERPETTAEEERERGGPSQLLLNTRLSLGPGEVVLVMYEGKGENLSLRRADESSAVRGR
jgi:hypothetical protein